MTTRRRHSATRNEPVVFLNPAAGGGHALQKWSDVQTRVRSTFDDLKLVIPSDSSRWVPLAETYLKSGSRRFIAAGGDGTVNALVNALMTAGAPRDVQLGAIGLGSSNDFHKPASPGRLISGISCRIDFERTEQRDVGVIRFQDGQGRWETRYWILNAALGLTAAANAFFNRPDAALKLLKRHSVDAAILYAAVRTILRSQSASRRIRIGTEPWRPVSLTNLGIVKSPHFSGQFCYDSPFESTGGGFHVHLCENMSLPRTLFTLWRLSQHRFSGLPHTTSSHANHLAVLAETPFPVEFDGEVIHTKRVLFGIAEKRLEVCV